MRLNWLVAATLLGASPVYAQVGHPPESSPYRDIIYSSSLMPFAGYMGGDGGNLGIGPHDGWLYGLRFDHRLSNIISLGLSFESGEMKRLIVDADDPVAIRVKGPVSQRLNILDATLQLNITGKKTWHRFAPFLGGTVGVTWAEDTKADTSGYHFGTRVALSPMMGFRFFAGPRLHLRGDVRYVFWELKYPTAYQQEPSKDPGTISDPHAVIPRGSLSEWSGGTEVRVALGIAF